jgi:hypothetical protein
MIFLAHIGPSVWLARRLTARDRTWGPAALAWTALSALLPDILDKPVFYLALVPTETGRVWAHTLLFSLLWCLVCWRWLKPLWPWALATPGHLILDGMWARPHTLFWPFLGNYFDLPEMMFPNHWRHWVWLYHNDPWVLAGLLAGEAAGLALLARAAWPMLSARLGGSAPRPLA